MSNFSDYKENQVDKISRKFSFKNNDFLKTNGKFIVSGTIALLVTIGMILGLISFYMNILNGLWLSIYTFIGVITLVISLHISFILSIIILIMSIKGIIRYFKENRGEIYDN